MMWWNGDVAWWGWLLMSFGMIAIWMLAIALVVWIVRAIDSPGRRVPDAEEILDRRLADGKISVEEFEERRRHLTAH